MLLFRQNNSFEFWLSPGPQAGAVDLQLEKGNKHKLRRRDPTQKASKMSGVELDADKPVQDQLRALRHDMTRSESDADAKTYL